MQNDSGPLEILSDDELRRINLLGQMFGHIVPREVADSPADAALLTDWIGLLDEVLDLFGLKNSPRCLTLITSRLLGPNTARLVREFRREKGRHLSWEEICDLLVGQLDATAPAALRTTDAAIGPSTELPTELSTNTNSSATDGGRLPNIHQTSTAVDYTERFLEHVDNFERTHGPLDPHTRYNLYVSGLNSDYQTIVLRKNLGPSLERAITTVARHDELNRINLEQLESLTSKSLRQLMEDESNSAESAGQTSFDDDDPTTNDGYQDEHLTYDPPFQMTIRRPTLRDTVSSRNRTDDSGLPTWRVTSDGGIETFVGKLDPLTDRDREILIANNICTRCRKKGHPLKNCGYRNRKK